MDIKVFNDILKFINEPLLTDEEYNGIKDTEDRNEKIFLSLKSVLISRGNANTPVKKLECYFFIKTGEHFSPDFNVNNILIGKSLNV